MITNDCKDIEYDGDEWGIWECPNCGKEHADPNRISETCCHCGQIVFLSWTDQFGGRDVIGTNGFTNPIE